MRSPKYEMLYRELLTEMIWEDRFEAAKVARRYPRAWIHFSHMQKLGINPSKGHHDPPGIYFYPVYWLFTDKASLSQFATEYEYYYIVRFKRTANIINLGRMTMTDVERIATANHWLDALREIVAHPELLANNRQPMVKRLLRQPGGLFYATLDYLANVKGRPWLGMLKGVDGLTDPGKGYISAGEIAQTVVFGRQHLIVLASGTNQDHGEREYASILRQIAEELGGRFYYQNKLPVADFTNDGRPFQVSFNLGVGRLNLAYYDRGFWLIRQERYDTHAGDRANHYRSLKNYVTSTADRAGPAGPPIYWNGATGSQVLKLIRPAPVNQRVDDDGLHLSQQMDSSGSIYASLRAIVNQDGMITIEAMLSLYDRIECSVSQRFDQQPIAVVANSVLDALARELLDKVPNPSALKKMQRIGGFDFGDRFHALV